MALALASKTKERKKKTHTLLFFDEKKKIKNSFTTSFEKLCIGATENNPCITVTALQLGPSALVPYRDPLGRCYGADFPVSVFLGLTSKAEASTRLTFFFPSTTKSPFFPPSNRQRPDPSHEPSSAFSAVRIRKLPCDSEVEVESWVGGALLDYSYYLLLFFFFFVETGNFFFLRLTLLFFQKKQKKL